MDLIDRDGLRKALGIDNPDCEKCSWRGVHLGCTRDGDFVDACVAINDAPTVELSNNSTILDRRNDELISRQAAIDVMSCINDSVCEQWAIDALEKLPSAELEIIYCKDCKHKPYTSDKYDYDNGDCGFEIIFPDYRCPCRCEDEYYNHIPDDDWYCANGERRTDG